jgi:hypothetical protein
MLLRTVTLALAATAAAAFSGEALASQLVDRNAKVISLQVNGTGQALVTYRVGGATRNVRVANAVNARAPSQAARQVAFKMDYSGRGFTGGGCTAYDGPSLPWYLRACKAPDGSYWALQSWQRMLANYGGRTAPWELRISHWSGDLPQLKMRLDWAYGGRFDHLYGTFSYAGTGVFGFRSTSQGVPLDTYGRNVYLDTMNSAYGKGWSRENSFLTHNPNGSFCYGFYPHGNHPSGKGTHYRATVIGPGVTPDIMWEGDAPGPFDKTVEEAANAEQKQLFAFSKGCSAR